MRFQKDIFTGKAQIRALNKPVLIAGIFQNIAEADVLRVKAGERGGGVAVEGREQRNAALRGDHARNGVVGAGQLHGVAEIQALRLLLAQFRRQTGENLLVEVGALQAFAVDIDQIELRVVDDLLRHLVVAVEVGVRQPGVRGDQAGDLAKGRRGLYRAGGAGHRQQTPAEMVRPLVAAQQPAQQADQQKEQQQQPESGHHIFTDARAGQAVGQGIEHRIVDAVAGEVVAGEERGVEQNEQHQQKQHKGKPELMATGFPRVNGNGRQEQRH